MGCLELVVGVMLVHGESRGAWGREGEMNVRVLLSLPLLFFALGLFCFVLSCLLAFDAFGCWESGRSVGNRSLRCSIFTVTTIG